MDGIKIEVTGNIARVIERPARITAGTVGLPVEFSFDNQWEGLSKTAVFKAGCTEMIVENLDVETIAPWETTANPNVWLSIGVYGVNADGSVAIPTIWANVCVICEGTNPEGDVSTAPTPPVWQRLWNAIGNLLGLTTNAKGNLVEAINEVNSIALAGGIESDPTLTQSGKAADAKATGDKIKSLTASDVGARPSDWIPTAEEVGARPSDWIPTAEEVGARANTWLPTVEQIGAAPATEATDHPGCYYRMVNGEKEWINPPMELDVEYRTTERCEGDVVYAKRITGGATVAGSKTLSNSGRVLYGIPIRYDALVGNCVSPYFHNNEITNDYSSYVRVELMGIHIYAGAKYTDKNTYVTVWYIK